MVVMFLQNAKERIITFIWKKWQEGNQTYSSLGENMQRHEYVTHKNYAEL